MLEEVRVIIIGAGAAGISAAARLLEKGLQHVTILEAENRVGGRIHTDEFADNVIELGAQWVHGERGNITYALASPHNLLDSSKYINDFTKQIVADSQGKIIPKEQSVEMLNMYYKISKALGDEVNDFNGTYGEYFSKRFYKECEENDLIDDIRAEQFLEWIHKFDNSIQCSDSWFDVSAKGLTEYWECEGDLLLNWRDNGYRTVFDLLTKKFPDESKELPVLERIIFNKEVSSIDHSIPDEISVKTNDGTKYTVNHIIFTPSLGVLKDQHNAIFVPPLPEIKQRAIKGLAIGTANKIFLEFPYRWWPEDSAGFGLIWSEEDKREFLSQNGQDNQWLCDVFQFFTVDYQPRVLSGWIVGRNARYIETLSDAVVLEGMCILLERFLGKAYDIPRPDKMSRSNWYTNKHFRGSYSFRSMVSEKMDVHARDLASPILSANGKPIILFAGEATHDHYYSTVHGAIETGFREADRLVEYYK